MTKRIVLIIFILSLAATLTGCKPLLKGYRDIGKIAFVSTNGLDINSDQENEVTNTIEYPIQSPSSSEKDSTGKPKNKVVSATGKTIADAARPLVASQSLLPVWSHCNYFIYGEETAKNGLLPFVDVNFRFYDIRRNANVFIAKNSTARDLIEKVSSGEQSTADLLETMVQTSKQSSVVNPVTFDDLFEMFHNPWRSAYIPVIAPNEAITIKDSGSTNYSLSGLAVFKGGKLVDFMDKNESIGLNWIIDTFDRGSLVIKDVNGDNVYLEIYSRGSEITPKINDDGQISIEIKITVDSNIAEIFAGSASLDESSRVYMEKQQEAAVRDYVTKAINFAQKNDTDVFDISGTINRKYPKQWNEIKNNWDDIFPDLNFDIKINSIIRRSFDIEEPVESPNIQGVSA
jgi:spore germination protein KC